MSVKLQILRDGHLVGEYDSLDPLRTITALLDDLNKVVEFIAAIQMALSFYRAGAESAEFRIGSVRVRFMKGEGR